MKCRDNLVRQREEAKKDPKKVNNLFVGFIFIEVHVLANKKIEKQNEQSIYLVFFVFSKTASAKERKTATGSCVKGMV